MALGRWALGAFNTRKVGENLFRGTSLFDGKPILVRPVGDVKRLLVDYHVGTKATRLAPRIMARAIPRTRNSCLVSLVAWREPSMTDARWERLVACHEAEIRLIQALLAKT
jgi:hypothetical protein